jgi:hypothetical protein
MAATVAAWCIQGQVVIAFSPSSKEEGLVQLRLRGWLLVDATYEQVDKSKERDETILRDYPQLRDDLSLGLPGERIAPVTRSLSSDTFRW